MAPDLLVFLVGAVVVLAVPGPSVIFAVTRTLEWGTSAGLITMVGLEVGLGVHVVAASVGLSALVSSSPTLLQVFRVCGAAHLLILAIQSLRTRSNTLVLRSGPQLPTRWTLFRSAVLVDVLNPKTGLFFLAFLPQFVRGQGGDARAHFLILGACIIALASLCDACWVLLTAATLHANARRQGHPPVMSRRLTWVSSCAYVGVAVLVLTG